MKRAILLLLVVLLMSFFVILAFSDGTGVREDVKSFLTGEEQPRFGQAEDDHMRDVFWLMLAARVVAVLLLILVLAYPPSSKDASIALGVFGGVIIVGLIVPWNTLFTLFHAVFFPQGNWMFPASSPLIQTYPGSYFQYFSIAWALLTSAVLGLIKLIKR